MHTISTSDIGPILLTMISTSMTTGAPATTKFNYIIYIWIKFIMNEDNMAYIVQK